MTYLRPHLDAATRKYWDSRDRLGRRRIGYFGTNVYRHGLLGGFIGAGHLLARMHGANPRRLLAAKCRAEQRRIFERELAPLFKKRHIRWLLDRPSALFGLGIPPSQFTALKGSEASMADVLHARLERLACDFDLADNYFAWQAFGRRYASGGSGPLPPYLQRENFEVLRARAGNVTVVHASLTEHLSHAARRLARRLCAARCPGLDDGRSNSTLCGPRSCARPGPAPASSSAPPARRRSCRAACPMRSCRGSTTTASLPAMDGEGPLLDLRRVPSLRAARLRRRAVAQPALPAAAHMDAIYRYQRYIYDASRKYYLWAATACSTSSSRRRAERCWRSRAGRGATSSRRAPLSACALLRLRYLRAPCSTPRAPRSRVRGSLIASTVVGDATTSSGERLFGVGAFDRVFISYALSMIPPWRQALRQALAGRGPGGRLHVVDFGEQQGGRGGSTQGFARLAAPILGGAAGGP